MSYIIYSFFIFALSWTSARAEDNAQGGFLQFKKAQQEKPADTPAGPAAAKPSDKSEGSAKTAKPAPKKAPKKPAPAPEKAEASSAPEPKAETPAAKAAEKPEADPKKSAGSEKSAGDHPSENEVSVVLNSNVGCYVVQFESTPGQIIPCTQPLPIKYTKRNCESSKVEEKAEVESVISCVNDKKIEMRFRTSADVILADLLVKRKSLGRAGVAIEYQPTLARKEESAMGKFLPEPKLEVLDAAKPDEAPIRYKVSGFAWFEQERTNKYGYDRGGTGLTAQTNFSANSPTQDSSSFFMNMGFELGKDRTTLVSLFEVGEVYFGDSNSGGAQGARAGNIIEVRNLYLDHEITKSWTGRLGVATTASDPRSFVFNDHIAVVQALYKTDLSEGTVWYGSSAQSRPTANSASRDFYAGASGTMGLLSGMKGTAFALFRYKNANDFAASNGSGGYVAAKGDTDYSWLGFTLDWEAFKPLGTQFTIIGNSVASRVGSENERYTAYLADLKLSYAWAASDITLTLEGLMTPGANNSVDSGTGYSIVGRRKSFISPVGAAYLMTIATSDGVDDAPGTPKQSIIADLNQAEGLKIAVLSLSKSFSKKTSGLLRAGILQTAESSASTGSAELGSEVDLQMIYQLTPTVTLQLDYGRFTPGAFFASNQRETADLATFKTKFAF